MNTNLQKKTAMQEIPPSLRPTGKVWRIMRKAFAESITAHSINDNWSGRMLAAAEDSLAKGDAGSAIGYAGAATCYVREAGAAARRCAAFAKEARGISRMTGNPLDGYAARDAGQWTVNARRCAAEARSILPRCRDIIRQAKADLAKTEI